MSETQLRRHEPQGEYALISLAIAGREWYRLWMAFDAGKLSQSLNPVSFVIAVTGIIVAWGFWKGYHFTNRLASIAIWLIVIRLLPQGNLLSRETLADLAKVSFCVWIAWYLWKQLSPSADSLSDGIHPSKGLLARIEDIERRTCYPKGGLSMVKQCDFTAIDYQWLSGCVQRATGGTCSVSDAINNIDLACDGAFLNVGQAIVGGPGNMAMIAFPNMKLELYAFSCSIESETGVIKPGVRLTFGNVRALDINRDTANALNWLVPLALAMWSDEVKSIEVTMIDNSKASVENRVDLSRFAQLHRFDGFGTLTALS